VVRSARAGHVRCSARFTGRKCRSRVWISLSAKPILARGRKTRKQAGHMSASDPSMLPKPILASRGPSTYEPSRAASRPSGFDPSRRITCRSPEALARGPRRAAVAITVPRSGAFLTGLATAVGPASRQMAALR
jgi:hypothetical protein